MPVNEGDEAAQEQPELELPDAEYSDPFDGMDITPFDPAEAVSIPLGTPLGTGDDTENEEPGPFDPRYKEDFEGLMYLGALSARFSYIGHRFHIRTLTTDELLAAGVITRRYEETMGGPRAYATAMVALATVSVDGRGLPSPIGEGDEDYAWAFERFDYAKARWFPFTIDYVHERLILLEERARSVLIEMTEQAKKVERRAA